MLAIGLPGTSHLLVCPMTDAPVDQARVRAVEDFVVNQKCTVLQLDVYGWLGELQHHAVVVRDTGEWPPMLR